MNTVDRETLCAFANSQVTLFHEKRLASLKKLKLDTVLLRKNPYLFRARNLTEASELMRVVLDAFLSSSEEGKFGNLLEELAIFVSSMCSGGKKSSTTGLDLEFDRDGVRYLVAIKSGGNWGNSTQQAKLKDLFQEAARRVRQSLQAQHVRPVLGICYGKTPGFEDKGTYWRYRGQSFWHFLSGDEDLYLDIIEPIGYQARKHNDDFAESRSKIQNRLTLEFTQRFCDGEGAIDWSKFVAFNSGNLVSRPASSLHK